ncbi:NAD(P)H-binding protein [Saccharothrix coeruleofusca]|uniref:NAD(P)-binding domain-containing protein n=1 Tax=Saccharothrix coeruleofusca TaxID=33919 RepID=A0A918AIX8_9PSEU|nr:NAD(P)H-binding protein [Saccharothrix coeruleofusca]GGP44055.1 hypothetical protein GCM10010185_14680 [Saccharothrix coeruleofusca]
MSASQWPDITRPDVGTALVAETPAGAAEVFAALERAPWPDGLLSVNAFVGAEDATALTYTQWAAGAADPAFFERLTGTEPVEYRLYRSTGRQVPAAPGCAVVVSVEFDGPDEQRQRRWVDTVFDALTSEAAPPAGLISANFHLSTDGTRLINYAEWTDARAHRDAMAKSGQGTVGSAPQWRRVLDFPVRRREFRRYHLLRGLSAPSRPQVLVTGATGAVGGQVVAQLRASGTPVRALVRDPGSAALPDGVDVRRGDLLAPETVAAAAEGADVAFLMWPFPTTDVVPAVLDALARHVRRVVFLSSGAVRDDLEEQENAIGAWHAEVERAIERSGLEWTFLRPHAFATNTLAWAPQIRDGDVVRGVYGAAAMPLLHEADIAAVAVRALVEGGHVGKRYVLTGPEALTQAEQVRVIGEAIGRPLRWEEITPEAARQRMLDQWPAAVVDVMLGAQARLVAEPGPRTSTVEEVTGVPARTFREWATDHAADFR